MKLKEKRLASFNYFIFQMFIVQATTDAPEYESSLQIAAKNKETHKDEDIPIKPAHYKILMDVKSESDLTAAVGKSAALQVF